MKIAVVGKGGSGKSTVSWLLVKFLAEQGKKVLAVDADYNMDLATNLGWDEDDAANLLNSAEPDFYKYQGFTEKDYYVDLPNKEGLKSFHLSEKDSFTSKYSTSILPNLDLMVFGGTHQDLLFGHRCSHAYISALKYYLPLLSLAKDEYVVVDSVAGVDMVNYGLYLGVDVIVAVVEPTKNSQKVAKQIKEVAGKLNIPVVFLGNKRKDDTHDLDLMSSLVLDESLLTLDYEKVKDENKASLKLLLEKLEEMDLKVEEQWERHKVWRQGYDLQMEKNKQEAYQFVKDGGNEE